nr:unnamed protein product [uncultured bacterium]
MLCSKPFFRTPNGKVVTLAQLQAHDMSGVPFPVDNALPVG